MADWQLVLAGAAGPVAGAFLTSLVQMRMQKEKERSARQQAFMEKREAACKAFIRYLYSIPERVAEQRSDPQSFAAAVQGTLVEARTAINDLILYGGRMMLAERQEVLKALAQFFHAVLEASRQEELPSSTDIHLIFEDHLGGPIRDLTLRMNQLLEDS